jgi:hypothetical protein
LNKVNEVIVLICCGAEAEWIAQCAWLFSHALVCCGDETETIYSSSTETQKEALAFGQLLTITVN